ncbi:hypothetical protein PIB30_105963 [Stylosanthes scabra]|uniref:Uncharacterized protein n=1 Tax=Stylosanthes scabra TaxID=79078 RepID=A0ABU6UXY8_9FABA|nr:hypothetical protein [Stylosanthes scabra]
MGWGFSLRIFIKLFRYRFKLGKLAKYPWNSECLAFSKGHVFRCMSWRSRGVSVASKLIRHVRDLVDRFWGVTLIELVANNQYLYSTPSERSIVKRGVMEAESLTL